MFAKVVACEIAFREICCCAARSVNLFDLHFLSQGFHDNPEAGLERLQAVVDDTAAGLFDAILLGYGLCNNMLSGLRARHAPLVVPRAHDCITFFLGSKERYQETFAAYPGTYYYTTGWLEHRARGGERPERPQGAALGEQRTYQEMVERYGEENARYLADFMGAWVQHYSRGAYIEFEFSAHLPHREQARALCREHGWEYAQLAGDLALLQDWLDGRWTEDRFLVVNPGEQVRPTYDARVIEAVPAAVPVRAGQR
ncbi:MAG: DUF1638 domain-containing protein [Candidatus Latescibacterota bacterium]